MRQTLNEKIASGYRLPNCLDAVTKELIRQWFGRRVCVNHFEEFFKRQCELDFPYYQEMLKVFTPGDTDVEWYVEKYMERNVESANTNESVTESDQTKTHNGSLATNRTSQGTSNHSSKHDSADNSASRDTTQARQNPMQASYTSGNENEFAGNVSVNGGEYSLRKPAQYMCAGHVLNPSATSDNFNENVAVGQSKDSGNESFNNTDNMTNTRNTTDVTNGSGTVTDNGSGTVSSVEKGRHELPAEIITKSMAAIGSSEAWNWLYMRLDKCFIMCFNIDDDEEDE